MIYVYRCPHCGVVAECHRKLAERDEARETANGHRDPYAVAYARLDAAAAEGERLHAEMEARVAAAVRLGLQRATARCEAAEAERDTLRIGVDFLKGLCGAIENPDGTFTYRPLALARAALAAETKEETK